MQFKENCALNIKNYFWKVLIFQWTFWITLTTFA